MRCRGLVMDWLCDSVRGEFMIAKTLAAAFKWLNYLALAHHARTMEKMH